MIRISDIKIDAKKNQQEILLKEIASRLRTAPKEIKSYTIHKQSIDARKKEKIYFIYTVDVKVKGEEKKILAKCKDKTVSIATDEQYTYPLEGNQLLNNPPVVIGAGPAGLFAALLLAELGYRPILLERGQAVDKRTEAVDEFWRTGKLDEHSNVQFGEGGAGTFSDGKLNTAIKNIRCHKVLDTFAAHGAPKEILYSNRPHIGTDILKNVVKSIRERIISLGGQVRFEAQATAFIVENGQIEGVVVNNDETLKSQAVILAIGHSARDTFEQLNQQGITMSPKAFAVGVRVEHKQEAINEAQYGSYARLGCLGAADYKLTYQASNGRSVYSFCMCPGGTVVAAASEEGGVVTNGMSEFARNKDNANSALVVSVNPDDFNADGPLAGVEFQRQWERLAYELAGGDYAAPIQLVGDFLADKMSTEMGHVQTSYQPSTKFCELKECLPAYAVEALKEALPVFGQKIKGFDDPEAVLIGVETRTSSPVRINRDEQCQSVSVRGLYPCGEGAGYAGGIVSAAVDGIRVAEEIVKRFSSFH